MFDITHVRRVLLSVAFVSESGVEQLEAKLKPHKAHLTVFAGIRNDITSFQGLRRLSQLTDDLYTVDTGSRNVLFHPKLYMVCGKTHSRLVIGSANLTLGGLNNNIEAGMLIDFDLANEADKAVADEIEAQLLALPPEYPNHIVKVTGIAVLDDLLLNGRITDELALPPPRPATAVTSANKGDIVPRIKLKVQPLRRALAKAKAAAKPIILKTTPAKGKKAAPIKAPVPASVGVEFEIVWESKALTERDLDVPTGANTHRTGSINLDKGLLPETVDQRHYFRDEVFSALTWQPTSVATTEEAYAKFQLVLKGISYGEFDLRIGHGTNKNSTTYKQRNAMTRLSWGAMREYIARPDLIGRNLALYRDKAAPTRFVLEID